MHSFNVHPSQTLFASTTYPTLVIPSEEGHSLANELHSEGSAVENQNRLRLHHGEPVAESLPGVTSSLYRRVLQHKAGEIDGFTKRHNINRPVDYEVFHQIGNAIAREKQVKSWTRAKRLAMIATKNPTWQDLAEGWGKKVELQIPRRVG